MTTLIPAVSKGAEVPPDKRVQPNVQNIVVCSSSDVHFGNNTNIPKPVTIAKQFKDVESGEARERNEKNATHWTWKGLHLPHGVNWVHGVTVTCVVLLLVTSMLSLRTGLENLSKNTPDIDNVLRLPSPLRMIARQEWLARPPEGPVDPMESPVPMVIITHTATENCSSQAACTFQVRTMQTYHIESRDWLDIGYNFLVGGDGAVYEGRGWNGVGMHTKGYNLRSVSIAFIGTFNDMLPPARQIEACKSLLNLGVEQGKLTKDYKLYGHRQLIPSLSPGELLYNEINKWPHFSKEI